MTEDDQRLRPRPRRLKTQTELRLVLFVHAVGQGEIPSRELLELVAEGVDRKLDGLEPWPEPAGAPRVLNTWERRIEVLSVWLLREAGLRRAAVAEALGIERNSVDTTVDYITEATKDGARIAAGTQLSALRKKGGAEVGSDAGTPLKPGERLDAGEVDDGTFAQVMEALDRSLSSNLPDAQAGRVRAHLEALHAKWTMAREERRVRDARGEFLE